MPAREYHIILHRDGGTMPLTVRKRKAEALQIARDIFNSNDRRWAYTYPEVQCHTYSPDGEKRVKHHLPY